MTDILGREVIITRTDVKGMIRAITYDPAQPFRWLILLEDRHGGLHNVSHSEIRLIPR
jgi:hypothetical protein